ncbi:MAG: LutC/YkgG family protein [Planctomycetota bacterium]|jgi:L-lactate dehydrogenase complex protein LldG
MSSREKILSRIRAALADDPSPQRPPVPEVWPRENPSTEAMADRFARELEALAGELHRCGSVQEARAQLSDVLGQLGEGTIGAIDHPLVREVTSGLPADRLEWGTSQTDVPSMARWPASVVPADCLLVDTGTCMVACGTSYERMMCYLPPACIVVAAADRMFEHMPAAWEEIARRTANPRLRGEFVFITGPSRTADIEKILILGVHGPKRLVVLLVG